MSVDVAVLDELVLGSARGGRKVAKPLALEVVRELGEGDLPALQAPQALGSTAPALVAIRNTHHMLARLLAEGRKPQECSLITGHSASRISILQNDPAFKDLVAYYRENVEAQYADVHARLAGLGMTAVEELQQRLEEEPEKFSAREVKEIAEFALDRSIAPKKTAGGPGGGGPGSGGLSININFVEPQAGGMPMLDVTPTGKSNG